ncbi:hypothetical protein DFH07DRAFT_742873, partial [Mycena maculata]
EDSGPSMASGFSLEQYQAARDPNIIVWLFKPRCPSKVKHWSGTNEYSPWHQNKIGSTLNAFAHYAYLFSQESTILADLRSMVLVCRWFLYILINIFQPRQQLTRMGRESRSC